MPHRPIRKRLKEWIEEPFEQRKVEPNSSLGKVLQDMLNHWKKLTLFLRKPGARLDNNVCEQALRRAIRHRKNSLFYKTAHGAAVGDLLMNLIHTCDLADENHLWSI